MTKHDPVPVRRFLVGGVPSPRSFTLDPYDVRQYTMNTATSGRMYFKNVAKVAGGDAFNARRTFNGGTRIAWLSTAKVYDLYRQHPDYFQFNDVDSYSEKNCQSYYPGVNANYNLGSNFVVRSAKAALLNQG